MRLVTWNCRRAAHRKLDALRRLEPDVAVVQECASRDVLGRKELPAVWAGDNPLQGLAVLAFGATKLSGAPESSPGTAIPVRVTHGKVGFNLLGKWACAEPSSYKAYVADVRSTLDEQEAFLRNGPAVVAGDLNSSAAFDAKSGGGHSALVERLGQLGLTSAYHSHFKEAHGAETRGTFFRSGRGPSYHLDYVFVPRAWKVSRVEVPVPGEWLKLSDHVPVIVTIDFAEG